MSEHNQDKDTVINALGGKKGLIDSGLPSIVFLVAFNVKQDLKIAIWAALTLSILLGIIRLAKKDTIQHSISGILGVLICAYFPEYNVSKYVFPVPFAFNQDNFLTLLPAK